MRGYLVLLAALCVVVAVEASSVRFVSIDEGQNGKDNKDRSEASDGTDPGIKKSVEDVVKKINDGEERSEKTVKSLDVERSSAGDKGSESAGEGVKKSASSEKPKIQKRDVRRALDQLSKRAMKRSSAEEVDGWNIFNARKIIIKYLSLQKTVVSKVTSGLIYAVERLETDQKEKDALITALKTFQKDIEQAYDNTINSLGSQVDASDMYSNSQRKFMRADDIPALMTAMNQRNPFALIPLVTRLINAITGAATVADMAASFSGSRYNLPGVAPLEMIQKIISMDGFPHMPWDPPMPDYL